MNLTIRCVDGIPADQLDLKTESQEARSRGLELVVGIVLLDHENRAFVQRRTLERKLFPGCWDILGGHVEEGETLLQALEREVQEETGWVHFSDLRLIARVDWEKLDQGRKIPVLEWDFLGKLDYPFPEPKLEKGKVDLYAWVGAEETALLQEHRDPSDSFIYDIVTHSLKVLS